MKRLITYLAVALLNLLAFIPFRVSQFMGKQIGKLLYKIRTRAREVTRVNLTLTHPHLEMQAQEYSIQQSLIHAGMTFAEMGVMWADKPANIRRLIKQVHNLELLTQALQRTQGLLILAPHQANWEILNATMTQYTPITAMYKPLKNQHFNRWMEVQRAKTGMHLVPTTRQGVKSLLDTLHAGGVVGFLPDQEPKPERGEFAPFYAAHALTPALPYELIQKTQCQVVFACALRLAHGKGFDVHFIAPDKDIYSTDKIACLSAMNKGIEACIELDIHQYNWSYKRFRRQPNTDMEPYAIAKVP